MSDFDYSDWGGPGTQRREDYVEHMLANPSVEPDISTRDDLERTIYGAYQDCPEMSGPKIALFLARAIWPEIQKLRDSQAAAPD